MKTNFNFFFHLIVCTAFLAAFVYGVSQPLVEQYITIFSFGILATTVIGMAGMIRSLSVLPVMEVRTNVKKN